MIAGLFESTFHLWISQLRARALTCFVAGFCGVWFSCFPGWAASQVTNSFPDTDPLIRRVAENQKEVESLLNAYTFTDNETLYKLGKEGTNSKPAHRYLLHHAHAVRKLHASRGA